MMAATDSLLHRSSVQTISVSVGEQASNKFNEVATNDVSSATQIRLITWKSYITQIKRRKCAFCCKMCCPLLFMLIMGILGLLRPLYTETVNCSDPSGNNCSDIYYGEEQHYFINSNNFLPYSFMASFICNYDPNTDQYTMPPNQIGIVLNENDINLKTRVEAINNIINSHYGQGPPYNNSGPFNCYFFSLDTSNVNWTNQSLLKYFQNENELENYIRDNKYGAPGYTFNGHNASNGALTPIAAAIVFKSVSSDGKIWDYSIRFNESSVPPTYQDNEYKIVDRVTKDSDTLISQSTEYYAYSGFLQFQWMIDRAITEYVAVDINNYPSVNSSYLDNFAKGYFVFPFSSYETDYYWQFMQYPFVIFASIMFIYPFIQIINILVTEKSTKIKEGMKMMGATERIYWMSHFLWFTMEFMTICLIVILIGFGMDVFLYSNTLIIFLWFWLFCLSQMTFSTLISTLFDNPKTANIVGFVLYFALIGLGASMSTMNTTQKTLFCLLATPCFIDSINIVVQYETGLTGIQWNNLNEKVSQFTFGNTLIMLLIDVILYLLLTWYLSNVYPTRFGQRRSPFFCLSKSFWKSCYKQNNDHGDDKCIDENSSGPLPCNNDDDDDDQYTDDNKLDPLKNYEDISNDDNLKNKVPIIRIRNLSKTFKSIFGGNNMVKAVDNISLDIYGGEVFCLLGHNGAGKTTTISILSGLLSSDGNGNGDTFINGYNINTDMSLIRKYLGVCPQHDVFWDLLTAEEHLRFSAKLKGVSDDKIQFEINRIINLFNMLDSGLWGKYPPNMSGGEKRRLSLAISLIGGSQIVFLDEPTSGMDPENRRKVWDIIEKEKKNRCIILTTHYMDEADILGDRIAIMSSGKIKCCGSSLYLKKLYGVGYTFTVSLKSNINIQDDEKEKDKNDIDSVKPEIDNVVNCIDGAKTISVAASEILYRLPFESSSQFADTFMKLDQNKNKLQIETFGIGVTTLEEVFLKIDNNNNSMKSMSMISNNNDNGDDDDGFDKYKFDQPDFQLENRNIFWIFCIHFYAILYKRFWWSIRDIKGILCQVILPTAFVAILFGVIMPFQINQKELQLSPNQYTDNGYTDDLIVPISKLDAIYNYTDLTNLYYTDGHKWSNFYYNNMQSIYGNNFSLSVGNQTELLSSHYFQYGIYNYDNSENTPYYGLYFTPSTSSISEVLLGSNASAYHSLPISFNIWNNWVLKNLYDATSQINVYSYPLPITQYEQNQDNVGQSIGTAVNLLIAFSLIPASSIYFICNEKSIGTKHQQFVSGISIPSYWVGTYISDILLGLPASGLVIGLVYLFDYTEFKGDATMPLFTSLMLFVSSSIAASYLLHFFFRSPGKAQFTLILFNILFGVTFVSVSASLSAFGGGEQAEKMNKYVRVLPVFLLGENIVNIINQSDGDNNQNESFWDYNVTQRNINYMIMESLGYFLLTLIIEYMRSIPRLLAKLGFVVDQPRKFMRLDDDVMAEQNRIKKAIDPITGKYKQGVLDDTVILSGLRKVYKGENKLSAPKPAVRDMYFGVEQGEVFGFLGVNGAGKTSTLNMLTGEIYPSDGIAYINGLSAIDDQLSIRRNIGFCPQNDAIFDLLTGYEHLKFYALIKGLKGNELKKQINTLLTALTLNKYHNRTSITYSGGNKRKLCVAQAMIGNPPVIFLDEPSTGMDPVSRRFMWKFINETMCGRAVILTTHSMQECEALCNRVGIMVNGQLSCIGSPQHLKSKFGKGYQLDITLKNVYIDNNDKNNDEEEEEKYDDKNRQRNIIHDLLEEFNKTFPTTILQQNGNKLLLEVRNYDFNDNDNDGNDDNNNSKLSALSKMFKFVENIKIKYSILSYALSQTSLEQIFLKMAASKGEIEQQSNFSMEQNELLKKIEKETKDKLIKRITILNRDHLQKILENEIKNGSQYIVKALNQCE